MVFVTMRNDDSPHLIPVFNQIAHIRDDEVNAKHIVVRERQSGVNYDDVISVLDYGHILADFAQAAQWNDHQLFFLSQFFYLLYYEILSVLTVYIGLPVGLRRPILPCRQSMPTVLSKMLAFRYNEQ